MFKAIAIVTAVAFALLGALAGQSAVVRSRLSRHHAVVNHTHSSLDYSL